MLKTRAVIIIALLGALLLPAQGVLAEGGTPALISVVGEGVSTLAPDMAVLELGVTSEAETARSAVDANSRAMSKVLKAMRDAGIAERDLQTSNFSIQPRYRHSPARDETPPVLVGYSVHNSLQVRVRDLDILGEVIDLSVSAGVNQGGNVSFGNDDPSTALGQARTLAVRDALAKAATIADAAGVSLGKIHSIAEQGGGPQPMMAREAMLHSTAATAVPVATGENSYSVRVNLQVEIAQ